MVMTIRVLDVTPRPMTWDDGSALARAIDAALIDGQSVNVSFAGISSVPTSFVHGAFYPALHRLGLAKLKASLLVIDSTRQINSVIRDRLADEATRLDLG